MVGTQSSAISWSGREGIRVIGKSLSKWSVAVLLSATSLTAQTGTQSEKLRQSAFAAEEQGNIAEAEQAWRGYLKVHSSLAEPYAHLGLLEARQEHYKEAIPLYRRALALSPGFPGLRLNLALALFKAGSLKEAIPQFSILLKAARPNSPEALRYNILLGMAHYGISQYPEASPHLRAGADADPQNLPIRLALAHSLLWSKQYSKVLEVYKEILALDPDSAEADMLAGEALDEMKDTSGAIEMFRKAVKAKPSQPNVHFGLGYLLWTQKQYIEAIQEFKAELALDPRHAQSMLYLADSQIQTNQYGDAKSLLEQTIEIDPSLSLAHLDLGILAGNEGKNEEALHEFLAAEKLNPGDVNVHWRLGRLYRAMGRKEEAKAELDKASSITKSADQELYRKMAGSQNGLPGTKAPLPAAPDQK